MSKKQYGTRLPPDKAEKLEQYCEETGISKAEVIRRAIDQHVDDDRDGDRDDSQTRRAWYLVNGVGISAILFNQLSLFDSEPVLATVLSAGIYASLVIFTYFTQDWAVL